MVILAYGDEALLTYSAPLWNPMMSAKPCVTEVVSETTSIFGRSKLAQGFGLCLTNMTAAKGHANRPLDHIHSRSSGHSGMHGPWLERRENAI